MSGQATITPMIQWMVLSSPYTHPAFIDMGNQFIAMIGGRGQPWDDERHFGVVVDDRSRVTKFAEAAGATVLDRPFNFRDPCGNQMEGVAYADVQFTKAEKVLRGMGLDLRKSGEALAELRAKLRPQAS